MAASKDINLSYFKGTHEKIGIEQGEQFKDLIHLARQILFDSEELQLMEKSYKKPRFISSDLFVKIAEKLFAFLYMPDIKKFYPEQYKRMTGIAKGANVSLGFINLMTYCEVELNKVDYVIGGCSCVGIPGQFSANGEPMIIKNFDYPVHFKELYTTRLDKPKNRFTVLNASVAPIAGNHDGINEHGLSITYNYGFGQDKPTYKVPITIIVQEALETCKTTQEAIDFISSSKRVGGALLMICDSCGDLRTLEVSSTLSEQRLPINQLLVNTNHYLTKKMAHIDIPSNAYYSENNVNALGGKRFRESSEKRFERITSLLKDCDKIDEKQLIDVFKDHGPENKPSMNSICMHSDYYSTTCSIIFYPFKKKMKIMYDNPCVGKYQELFIPSQ